MGIPIDNNACLYNLHFADDQVLCAKDKEDLQYMTRKAIEEYEQWGLKFHIGKTKYMCIGEDSTDIELENNIKIDSCKEYRYLSVSFNKKETHEEELLTTIATSRRIIGCLNGIP